MQPMRLVTVKGRELAPSAATKAGAGGGHESWRRRRPRKLAPEAATNLHWRAPTGKDRLSGGRNRSGDQRLGGPSSSIVAPVLWPARVPVLSQPACHPPVLLLPRAGVHGLAP